MFDEIKKMFYFCLFFRRMWRFGMFSSSWSKLRKLSSLKVILKYGVSVCITYNSWLLSMLDRIINSLWGVDFFDSSQDLEIFLFKNFSSYFTTWLSSDFGRLEMAISSNDWERLSMSSWAKGRILNILILQGQSPPPTQFCLHIIFSNDFFFIIIKCLATFVHSSNIRVSFWSNAPISEISTFSISMQRVYLHWNFNGF